jgi:hypothetical protein
MLRHNWESCLQRKYQPNLARSAEALMNLI